MSMPGFAVLDTETTGLSPTANRIVEIAVVTLSPDGDLTGTWSTLLDPQGPVGPTAIHHITPDDIATAPTFPAIVGDLTDLLRGHLLVGHNVTFDLRFLAAEYRRAGWPIHFGADSAIDTMAISRRLYREHRQHTLEACCARSQITNLMAHSALGDTLATARLLIELVQADGGFPHLTARQRWEDRAHSIVWPDPPALHTPTVARAVLGAAQQAALQREISHRLGHDGVTQPPSQRTILTADERRLMADRPPHFGTVG
ncbi:MAG: 3'-5' exonuclease [Propionibacteriaceae bacterium]|jgi:DNA polymerase-3 subunit epsilon|nr:3'-5' exonuclease [Propionibacteriaceae bacterium]